MPMTDERTSILSLAGRTVMRIERDPDAPVVLRVYDEHDKLMFKAISIWDENGLQFDTTAIEAENNSENSDCPLPS